MKRLAYPTLLAAFVLCILLPMAFHGLWIPDESRNAQISQAMLQSGDWVSRTCWACATSRSLPAATG